MDKKIRFECGLMSPKEIVEGALYAVHQDIEDIDNVRIELFFDDANNLSVMITADVEVETEVDSETTKWIHVIVVCYKGEVTLKFD